MTKYIFKFIQITSVHHELKLNSGVNKVDSWPLHFEAIDNNGLMQHMSSLVTRMIVSRTSFWVV